MADPWRESDARFRLLVEAVKDYAIFMLDPAGPRGDLERGREAHQGLRGAARSSASTSRVSTTKGPAQRRDLRARAGDRRAREALRGRGLARAQGRLEVLGQRGDHGAAEQERRAGRIHQGDARPDRAPPPAGRAAARRQGRGGDPRARRVPVAGVARAEDAAHDPADAARHAAGRASAIRRTRRSRPSSGAPPRAAAAWRASSTR